MHGRRLDDSTSAASIATSEASTDRFAYDSSMTLSAHRDIASRFLPDRYYYWYTLCKLATDPLYGAVQRAYSGAREPLLDIGCGLGLLLHYLRTHDSNVDYFGIDNDSTKIAMARVVAANHGYGNARFETCDPAVDFPEHRGSVAVLDVLQFFDPEARNELIAKIARCISADGKLVIRAGLEDDSWRASVSRIGDRFAHLTRWMKSRPKTQPGRDDLERLLTSLGMRSEFRPLWGHTPFNNWLIVAWRV
jgi:SAM-dependent methyltransferase